MRDTVTLRIEHVAAEAETVVFTELEIDCRPAVGPVLYGTTADGKPRRWLLSQLRRVRVILADAEETLP